MIFRIRKSGVRLGSLAAVLVCFFVSGVTSDVNAEELLKKAKKEGVRIGFSNYRPYSFVDDDGKVRGESVDVVKAILAKMGITKIETMAVEFGAMIPGLKVNRFDIIASGLSVRPKRCEEVLFSEPYCTVQQTFVVKKGNPHNIKSYEGIAEKGYRLGIISGGQQLEFATWAGVEKNKIAQLPDLPTALEALRAGRIDALGLVSLSAAGAVMQTEEQGKADLERSPLISEVKGRSVVTHNAFAFSKENSPFVEEFNKALKSYIGTQEHLDTIKKYGLTREDLPFKTISELCSASQ